MSDEDSLQQDNVSEIDEIDENDNIDEGYRIKPVPGAFASYKFLSHLVQQIYNVCICLQQAVREYATLDTADQRQVWEDLVGTDGHRRVFVQGRELVTFAQEYEPPSMVQEAIHQLEQYMEQLPPQHKQAYMQALQQAPAYVTNRALRLKFLRAEKFDIAETGQRLTRHFEEKCKLFGPERLGRDITWEDLNDEDRESLANGYLQVLPTLDQSNRRVIFYYKELSNTQGTSDCYKYRENILRAFWFVANVMSREEDVQKLGVVNVVYNVGEFPKHGIDYEKSRWLSRLFRAIPLRFNSFYVCLDDSAWVTVVETFAVMISRFLRIRLRMIIGVHTVVKEKLNAVGVPADAMPVNDDSQLLVKDWQKWIKRQKELERNESAGPPPLRLDDLLLFKPNAIAHLMDATAAHYGRKRPYSMIG